MKPAHHLSNFGFDHFLLILITVIVLFGPEFSSAPLTFRFITIGYVAFIILIFRHFRKNISNILSPLDFEVINIIKTTPQNSHLIFKLITYSFVGVLLALIQAVVGMFSPVDFFSSNHPECIGWPVSFICGGDEFRIRGLILSSLFWGMLYWLWIEFQIRIKNK